MLHAKNTLSSCLCVSLHSGPEHEWVSPSVKKTVCIEAVSVVCAYEGGGGAVKSWFVHTPIYFWDNS